ncbi:MAG: hypothetical protein CFE21_02225 [Bacteroidetes bacterium B1(2017)]|nr:MAG: hypothetical protein CFE21_02225 [Bacteroidetes bacterium B1(2017)]
MNIFLKSFLFTLALFQFSAVSAQKQIPGKPYQKSIKPVSPSSYLEAKTPATLGSSQLGSLKPLSAFESTSIAFSGYFPLPQSSALNKAGLSVTQKVSLALAEVKETIGLKNYEDAYVLKENSIDELGMSHIKFAQQVKGVEVWGAEMILHERNGKQFLNGQFFAEPATVLTSSLSASEAFVKAQNFLKTKTTLRDLTAQQIKLLNYAGPVIKKILYPVNNQLVLCWFVESKPNFVSTWRCFVNATSGEIVQAYNQACTIDGPKTASANDLNGTSRTINTYEKSGVTYMIDATKTMFDAAKSKLPDDPIGAVWTVDAQNTYVASVVHISSSTNSNWPAKGVSAHFNAGIAFDYYKNTHSRNSINGNGGTIISVINVTEQNGQGMDNAFWTGELMCYGNGNVAFKPLAGSLDVAGHEMTHGVVQNSANLEYQGQSGAINESMADIFGCMMDRDDWLLGDDVVKTQYFPTGALRSLSDPHNGGSSLNDNGYQPRTMSEYYTGTQDNGGVHTNSGIPNWAFYKFAVSVTKEKAERVYYRALTKYLTKTSKFVDLRIAVVQSCIDLYGDNSAEYTAARNAFSAVGIYATDPGGGGGTGGGGTSNAVDLTVNPGQDYILSYDASTTDATTVYKSSTTATNYVAQSTREMKRRPSVTDDGSFAVFVGSDSKIYKLTIGSSPTETVLSSQAIWDNAVVSKDGKRMAAITTSVDSAIYVYDFTIQTWQKFHLYNPTYTAGVNAGSVLYADGLEFDYTGEKVVYDARNIINNAGGTDIDFWDIGMIQVYDNATHTYGNGKVEKLYTQLPADVSIGNPSFSKNSPYILAFDYIDNVANKYAVIGKNILSNTDDIIVLNDQISYPNYSKLDDQVIYDVTTTQGQKWLASVGVETNKITGKSNAAVLIPDAYWGTWYCTGTRSLTSAGKDITSFSFPGLNPPVTGVITGTTIQVDIPTTTTTDFTKLVAVFTSSAFTSVLVDTTTQISGVTANNFTNSAVTPIVYKVKAQDGTTKNYSVKVGSYNGVKENTKSDLSVFPNPSNQFLNLKLNGNFEYVLRDLQGKELEFGSGLNQKMIDVSKFENGLYLLLIKELGSEHSQLITIQH